MLKQRHPIVFVVLVDIPLTGLPAWAIVVAAS